MNRTYKDERAERKANKWFSANGISTKSIYVGTAEVFQAIKLATNTLRNKGSVLEQNQAATLNNFLHAAGSAKKREKITQAQCYKIMNIAKSAQRRYAKITKARK